MTDREDSKETSLSPKPNRHIDLSSIVTTVYALRRGGDRQTTLAAVDGLIELCNFGGKICLPAVKQMMSGNITSVHVFIDY